MARAIVIVLLGAGAVANAASPADADVKCGDNIATYRKGTVFSPTLQRLTYVNCSGRTLHRKADIAWANDGACTRVGPWATVSLARDVPMSGLISIRGSKGC